MAKTHRFLGTEFDDKITQFTLEPLFKSGDLERPKNHHSVVIRGKDGDDIIGYTLAGQITQDDSWAVELKAGAGNDTLLIGQGHKAMGGADNDLLVFESGGDLDKATIARGGEGADTFVFAGRVNSQEAVTRIKDFDPTEDRLGIEGPNNNLKDADWILDHAHQKGDNVIIRYDTNKDDDWVRIVLKNVDLDDLTADVFLTDYDFL